MIVALAAVLVMAALLAGAGWWVAVRLERMLVELTAEVRMLRRRLDPDN